MRVRFVGRWAAVSLGAGLLAIPIAGGAGPEPVLTASEGAPAPRSIGVGAGATAVTTAPPSTTVTALDGGSGNPGSGSPTGEGTDPATPPPAGGTLTGRVTSLATGAALPSICVAAEFGPGDSRGATSAPDGSWSVRSPAGAASAVLRFDDCDGLAPHYLSATPPPVVVAEDTVVDVALQPASTIVATVVGPSGRPEPGVCVTVSDGSAHPAYLTTDGAGVARMVGAPVGDLAIGVTVRCGEAPLPIEPRSVRTRPGSLEQVELVVPRPGNDDRSGAAPVSTGADLRGGGLASVEDGEPQPSCLGGPVTLSVWFVRLPGTAATVGVHGVGHGGDGESAVALYVEGPGGALHEVACAVGGPHPARSAVAAVAAGQRVWVQIAGTGTWTHSGGVWTEGPV